MIRGGGDGGDDEGSGKAVDEVAGLGESSSVAWCSAAMRRAKKKS